MSIVFFGTPEFAVPSLMALIGAGEDIALVVTQTDKLKGRGHKPTQPPVKKAALEAGLRVIQPATLKDRTLLREIASTEPEFIVVVAYGKILPGSILQIPLYGCINLHASLLPKYRGAAPIAWAIINGERQTGVTTMLMDEGLDTGPILLQRGIEISDDDTAGSLSLKLAELGASLLIETLKGMRDGTVKPILQKGEASYAPPLKKEDGLIDWSKSAIEIFNFVRGMQPWPGAYCYIGDERVKILKTKPIKTDGKPGMIVKGRDELIIGTGYGLLSIVELQPSGKNPMPASAFLLGRKLTEGTYIQ
ncbi:MAG: methionyl-tRNA formyltransferase [Thermodesulfovibrionales bacterium]